MREELKYVLPVDALPDVRRAIRPFTELDAYGRGFEERGYTVRSIYLDSPSLRYYHEKKGHLASRKKVRVRAYNDRGEDDSVFLEIKRKEESAISKERTTVAYRDLDVLFETGAYDVYASASAADVGRRVCYHVLRDNLGPTSLVVYEREAFEGKFDDSFRITLDRSIRGRMYPSLGELYEEDGLVEAMPGFFVMEVKFDFRMPGWMRAVIAEFGLMQQALSKYCICVDSFERRIDTRTAVLACAPPVVSSTARR